MVTAITKQANCQSSNSTSKKKMALMGWTLGKKAKACLSTTQRAAKRVIRVKRLRDTAYPPSQS